MKRLTCDIVKDLIPSYLDGICSDTSRAAVEEHLAGCQGCRAFLHRVQDTFLTAEAVNLETLDYMKKVKRHYLRKNMIAAGICLLFGLLLMALPKASWFPQKLQYGWYYALFPLLTLSLAPLLFNSSGPTPKNRLQKWAGGAGICGILCCIVLEFLFHPFFRSKAALSFLSPEKTGILLDYQRRIILLIELVFFLLLVFTAVKKDHSPGIWPLWNLTGCFLCLVFGCVLHQLDTPEAYLRMLLSRTGIILLEGLVLAKILLLLKKRSDRFQENSGFPKM